MDYTESNPQKWFKAQSYKWQGRNFCAQGIISEYNPFESPEGLFNEFYQLMRKIEEYRAVYMTIGTIYIQGKNNYRKTRTTFAQIKHKLDAIKSEIIELYIDFSGRWGMLGCGYSRMLDTSVYKTRREGIVHEQNKIKKVILREADTSFDIDIPKMLNTRPKNNKYEILVPDGLPASGGMIPLSAWSKDYDSMNFLRYSESFDALTGCRELLNILNDINAQDDENEVFLYPSVLNINENNTTWRFNSLIQAISIIYMLNKSGKLSKTWGICCECKNIFRIYNNYNIKYCDSACYNAAKAKRYRSKKE